MEGTATKSTAPISNGSHVVPQSLETDAKYQQQENNNVLPPQPMNGTMPPQQVYVNAPIDTGPHQDVGSLEAQFQSLGVNAPADGQGEGVNDEAGEGDNDGEENDEEPVKLFVGQVRLQMQQFCV